MKYSREIFNFSRLQPRKLNRNFASPTSNHLNNFKVQSYSTRTLFQNSRYQYIRYKHLLLFAAPLTTMVPPLNEPAENIANGATTALRQGKSTKKHSKVVSFLHVLYGVCCC